MAVQLISAPYVWGEFIWGEDPWGQYIYELPGGLTFDRDTQSLRVERWDLALANGGRSAGQEVKDRRVSVSGNIICDTRAANRALMQEIRYEASKSGLYLRLDSGAILALSRLTGDLDEDPIQLSDRACSRVKIEWQCDDPFWIAESRQSQSVTVYGDTVFTIDGLEGGNPCEYGQAIRITITAGVSGGPGAITLTNNTDGGMNCGYSDPSLVNGASAVLDFAAGCLVTRSAPAGNSIAYFTGEPLRLLTRDNEIAYTGGPATILFEWVPRWL